jgi:hypothetical protein
MVGQSGLLYLRFENKLTGWEIFNGEAEPRSYMEWSRTAFFGFPRLAGVFADGGMWLHYTTDIEDTTLLWLDKKGNQLNRAQLPYRPGFMGGMDEDFVSYVCGTRSDHIECAAVEKGADEPKWTLALEEAASVSGLALIPERLYVAAEDGILFAIGNE